MSEWISFFGSVSSIAGAAISIYIAATVWRIRASFVRQALIPQFINTLRRIAKNLENAIESQDESRVRQALAQVKSVRGIIERHAQDVNQAGRFQANIVHAENSTGASLFRNAINVHNDVLAEVVRLKLLKTEIEWSRTNG